MNDYDRQTEDWATCLIFLIVILFLIGIFISDGKLY